MSRWEAQRGAPLCSNENVLPDKRSKTEKQYKNTDDYRERGIGTAVLFDGTLAAGASSYTVYQGGIEIEIDTKEEHRRRGLARACAARLILECLDRGLYPAWDAHNKASPALALKLGYHFDKEYEAFEICKQDS